MASPFPSEESPSASVAVSKIEETNSPREPWSAAFRSGFVAPWSGFVYLRRHPRLWWYGVVPVLLAAAVVGAVQLHRRLEVTPEVR